MMKVMVSLRAAYLFKSLDEINILYHHIIHSRYQEHLYSKLIENKINSGVPNLTLKTAKMTYKALFYILIDKFKFLNLDWLTTLP